MSGGWTQVERRALQGTDYSKPQSRFSYWLFRDRDCGPVIGHVIVWGGLLLVALIVLFGGK